jgi:hypothetical protein
MKPLFNEYLAENEDGRQVSETVYPLLQKVYQAAKELDLDFRDVASIINSLNGAVEAEFVLRRSSNMLKQERLSLCKKKI